MTSNVLNQTSSFVLFEHVVPENAHLGEVIIISGFVSLGIATDLNFGLIVGRIVVRPTERIGEIVRSATLVVSVCLWTIALIVASFERTIDGDL